MKALMCQRRFIGLILSGAKPHTIRPNGKRIYKTGEIVSLRYWLYAAYRSPQVEFARVRIKNVEAIAVHKDGVSLGDGTLRAFWMGEHSKERAPLLNKLARDDGFANWAEMRDWFENAHGLPFHGRIIHFFVVEAFQ